MRRERKKTDISPDREASSKTDANAPITGVKCNSSVFAEGVFMIRKKNRGYANLVRQRFIRFPEDHRIKKHNNPILHSFFNNCHEIATFNLLYQHV